MKHQALLILLSVLLLSIGCSKDSPSSGTVSGQSNSPFSLKKGQMARIATSADDVQLTLTGIADCLTNGIALASSNITLHVSDGAASEDIRITIPLCNFQHGDSLAGAATKGGKIIIVHSVQYETGVGMMKGLAANLTVK